MAFTIIFFIGHYMREISNKHCLLPFFIFLYFSISRFYHLADMYYVLMAACGSSGYKEADVLTCVNLLMDRGADVNVYDR